MDVVLLCAPCVLAFPAAFALFTSHADLVPKRRVEKRLYATLLMAEKLPSDTVGAPGVRRDIDRQTLRVAYAAQFPQRARELRHVALIGSSLVASVLAYYLLWSDSSSLLSLLLALAAVAGASLWFERALRNFGRNDGVARELFEYFGAPAGLVRPRTELAAKSPALTLDEVFHRAADIRDASTAPMSTLDAVNAVLAKAHMHVDWRAELSRLARRIRRVDYRGHAATSYDWLLRRLLGPFFAWRLRFLDDTERWRTARAATSGDVFTAAWLPTHYRNERDRLAGHWERLAALR